MRLKDLVEAVKKLEPSKSRDPNWRDIEALRKSGASGSHKDKTKTIPRKEKYKKTPMEQQFESFVSEKITKDTEMGDVIKDFYKSDAPQFKGKSKAKRRQMAIAAKLSQESSDIFKGLEQVEETATAGATVSASIASVASPHLAIGDAKTRKKYGLVGGLPNPPKAKKQKPTDNALNMKDTSIFGGPLKR